MSRKKDERGGNSGKDRRRVWKKGERERERKEICEVNWEKEGDTEEIGQSKGERQRGRKENCEREGETERGPGGDRDEEKR